MRELVVVNDINKKRVIKEQTLHSKLHQKKVMGYRELIKKLYFEYDGEATLYIMDNYHVSKEIADIYLSNLYYIKDNDTSIPKINLLQQIKRELDEHKLLKKSPLWIEQLKEWKVVFDHISNQDYFFSEIVEKCKRITEVEVKNSWNKENEFYEITECATPKDEVIFVCSKICHLLESGIPINRIYLTNLTESHRENFEIYKDIFHLPIQTRNNEALISTVISSSFLQNIDMELKENINLLSEKFTKEAEQEQINQIINICNKYSGIKDEKGKKILILEDLKSEKIEKEELTESIQEIDYLKEIVEDDAYVFVLGVNEGTFPHLQKDENFLSDVERKILKMNLTNEINQMIKKEYIQKLKAFSNTFLSFAKRDGKMDLYPASLLEEIPCQIQKLKEKDFSVSHQYNKLFYATKLDELRKYGNQDQNLKKLAGTYKNLPYMKYNNQFKPFCFPKNFLAKKRLSYSSLDVYFHCAFRFYLDNVLHLNCYEDTFDKKIGVLFHQILRESYLKNFNFETSWQENMRKISIRNMKELFFLNKLKEDIYRVVETLKEYEKSVSLQVLTEQEIIMPVEKYPDYTLVGILDKVYFLKEQENTLIAIVDYKTGNANLNLDSILYGINMQIPIYLLLLEKLPLSNIKPIGIYLQKVLPSIPEQDKIHTEEELKKKMLKLQGFSIKEENRLIKFDPTYENSKWISGMKTSSKGFYPYAKVWNENDFKKISLITQRKIEEAIEEIEKGNYQINPKRIGMELVGCAYCTYKDICYRTEKDIQNLKEQKLNNVLGGSDYAKMDERTE